MLKCPYIPDLVENCSKSPNPRNINMKTDICTPEINKMKLQPIVGKYRCPTVSKIHLLAYTRNGNFALAPPGVVGEPTGTASDG